MKVSPTSLCRDDGRRRADVRAREALNGLDYLEVSSDQTRLTAYFLKKAPPHLHPGNIRLTGGRRVPGQSLRVLDVQVCPNQDPERDDCLQIRLDRPGDFSCYTLCLVEADQDGQPTERPLPGFDPRYRCLDFSFKAGCPTDLDCAAPVPAEPEALPEPVLDYLARDYETFRQLMLDRLALNVPDWRERHVPDLGLTLVELLAATGDHLSYQLDVIATEAYLETANRRVSVRRHARLVDYAMHEGCAARTLVYLEVGQDLALDLRSAQFLTGLEGVSENSVLTRAQLQGTASDAYEVFEPLGIPPAQFYAAHNDLHFYTWGERGCCLPRGATQATLQDGTPGGPDREPQRALHLKAGDLLIFEEVRSPRTGARADAHPTHRHAVRLTRVEPGLDPLYDQPVLHIEWAAADALPFPLCLSAPGPDCLELEISLAHGNVIPVSHGRRVQECLGVVDAPPGWPSCDCGCEGEPPPPGRPFRPALTRAPIVFQPPVRRGPVTASELLSPDPRAARPEVTLRSHVPPEHGDPCAAAVPEDAPTWTASSDLLGSGPDDLNFVLEIDDDQVGQLRFGDDRQGRRPEGGQVFHAAYRVGGGPAGNVGAGAIRHLLGPEVGGLHLAVHQPLPAVGGAAPESVAEVKQFAPFTFRHRLERAVTPEDYAALVQRDFPEVQRAAARLVWTGAGSALQVAVDVQGQEEAAPELLSRIAAHLERYRRIGHDLEVRAAELVPLDVRLEACVHPHVLQAHVKAGLLAQLGRGLLPEGRKAFFHPDNLTFGQGVTLSALVVAARQVPGLDDVQVTRLQRYAPGTRLTDPLALNAGILKLGPFQIAQLDNDPSFPERGVLTLTLRGGR